MCYDATSARNSREHNGANVLTLGSTVISDNEMREIVRVWLSAELTEERHRRRIAKIDGVVGLRDEITVLPVSTFDDELRFKIARSIYGHSNFWNYAIMPNPPIHIVVEHGRVTLTGIVNSEVDRVLARSLASQFGAFSITNDLKTDAEVRDALEREGIEKRDHTR